MSARGQLTINWPSATFRDLQRALLHLLTCFSLAVQFWCCDDNARGPKPAQAMIAALLFEAEPMVHPHVLAAYDQAIRVFRKARIPYRETGGIALNFYGAGRPTKDVDLIVRRTDWLRAVRVLGRIATDQPGIRFGLPGEPKPGLAVIGPHDVPIELWPEGTTHDQIARI